VNEYIKKTKSRIVWCPTAVRSHRTMDDRFFFCCSFLYRSPSFSALRTVRARGGAEITITHTHAHRWNEIQNGPSVAQGRLDRRNVANRARRYPLFPTPTFDYENPTRSRNGLSNSSSSSSALITIDVIETRGNTVKNVFAASAADFRIYRSTSLYTRRLLPRHTLDDVN